MEMKLPDGWEIAPIGEIFDTSSGTTPPRAMYDRYFRNGTIPWVKTLDLNNSEIHLTDEAVTDVALSETSLRIYTEGSVLVAMYGGFNQIGRTGLLRIPGSVNQAVTAILPNRKRVVPRYLLDFLNFNVGYWKTVASSSRKDPNITSNDVRTFPLTLPPLPEQSAIASALSDVDALLSSLDALIAKKRDIKQAAMQQLLTGKARLPGFEGGWTVKRLDQLANIRSGGTPSTTVSRFWDGGIPWCTPTDITRLDGGKYLLDTSRQITPEGLSNSSAELIPANSVVMTSRATIGECAINLKPVTTNQGFKNFVPFEDTDVSFLYYLLQTQRQGFIQLCSGSTFLEIGKTQLAAYKVHLPSTKVEQTAIAEVLSDMDAELAALEARRDKTRLLKQGMMQELLTGKTRLV
ncbi:restriction endonuclease subunit S [Burkholderia pseudomallei]|nr:restriction endonuclease subunit S [Burkholderia pseudomallei]MBF3721662.1 restriction endonuclease subunit S [Burkholderia pseudomallei]MBF3730700.1 restriction endonuclease subunit S [Burkholderia pseudomallei]MBF3844573.1 restriction endonuclease subunit S [Burkholderia pseudomallei]MBF4073205.1 restriction endonuclease subunit S [Burkholderia pseudomallei]